jgi:predicted metal-dependent peptidase
MPEPASVHLHRGTRAVQRMVEFAPSTGGLALWAHHRDRAADEPVPTIATDGHTIWYGPGFEALTLPQQAGLVAHEVLHVALRHPQRYTELQQVVGDVDLQLFNLCADAIVDSTLSHLSWLELPAAAVTLDRLLVTSLGIEQTLDKALLEWDVERLYREIDDRRQDGRDGKRQGRKQQEGGEDGKASKRSSDKSAQESENASGQQADGPRAARARSLARGLVPDLLPGRQGAGSPEDEAEASREWRERLTRAHAGDGAHSMLRTLLADLPKTRTPWEQVLRMQLGRALSPRAETSWSRPARSYIANQGRMGSRRMPFEPGQTQSKRVPRLAVVVDVSGSIDTTLMERFAREIEAITRRLETGLVLIVGDERVQRVERFKPGQSDLRGIEFQGGGGTDFTPLLEEADKHLPDIGVVLTDLDGPARFRPHWPVVWAVTEKDAHAEAPFGRKIVLA